MFPPSEPFFREGIQGRSARGTYFGKRVATTEENLEELSHDHSEARPVVGMDVPKLPILCS